MTWSYSGNPANSNGDAVRFNIGDTDPTRPILQDEEIAYLIAEELPVNGNILWVSYQVARRAANKYAGEVNVSGDGVSVNVEALQDKLLKVAAELKVAYRESLGGAAPDVGGIYWWDWPDPTVKLPAFGVGMGDNYRAGRQDDDNVAANFPGYDTGGDWVYGWGDV